MRVLAEMIVGLISGGFGGNILTKAFLKRIDLGSQGNTMVGFIGGLLCVQLYSAAGSTGTTWIVSDIAYAALGGGVAICTVGSLWKLIVASYALRRGLCPHCWSSDTYPSLPESVSERIATRILLRPICCHGCTGR